MHTVDTKLSNLTNLRVHIAPVGFEVDRIVIPAKEMKADKVWLLVHDNPAKDKAGPFVERVRKNLKKEKIAVEIGYHNRLDLFQIIRSVKEIIGKEHGNTRYVNLSSGSKIQAIACMMACMMFNDEDDSNRVIPFYAEAKEYLGFKGEQLSSGVKNIMEIPSYEIQTPDKKHVEALKIIKENGGRLTKKEMADLCDQRGLILVNAEKQNYSQARFASLDKNIIQPLQEKWKFVEVEKVGRTRWINITQDGKNAAEFLF